MTSSGSKSLPSLGFLTIHEHSEHGLFGGYLVLNMAARPLEFHCTAPVRANRAQEILFGPTLKPYLYGEQIAHTLFTKARHKPALICTDLQPILELRSLIEVPVLLLTGGAEKTSHQGDVDHADADPSSARADSVADLEFRVDSPSRHEPHVALHSFALGDNQVAVAQNFAADQSTVSQCWDKHAQGVDLQEPFGRIREAIQEAQRAAR